MNEQSAKKYTSKMFGKRDFDGLVVTKTTINENSDFIPGTVN